MTRATPQRVAERLFRFLLRAYPGGFPRVLQDEMTDAFRDRCRQARVRWGASGVAFVLGRESLDLAYNAVLEWGDPRAAMKGDDGPMETLLQDVRFAVRSLVQRPAFAAVSIVILALTIGATTGIFTLIDRLLLESPAGIGHPDQLVGLGFEFQGSVKTSFSHPDFEYLRDHGEAFLGVAASSPLLLDFQAGAEPQRIRSDIVSGNFFSVLDVDFSLGRGFLPEETSATGSEPVVVVSHAMWRDRFGSDSALVGSTIRLNGHPFRVVGVAPEGFRGFQALAPMPEVWVPLSSQPISMPRDWAPLESREDVWLSLVARLRDGVTLRQAKTMTDLQVQRLIEAHYFEAEMGSDVGIALLPQFAFSPKARKIMTRLFTFLMAVVLLVLIIACANLASLLLTRAAGRQREVGIRLALGASRGRVLRLLMTESMLVSLIGGALGLVVSAWVVDLVVTLSRRPLTVETRPDATILAFALAVSVITGLLLGIIPALHASRRDISGALKDGLNVLASSRLGGRSALVVVQVAISVVLLVTAGLFVRSLRSLQSIDPGFEPAGLLLSSVDLRPQGYGEVETHALYRQLLKSVQDLPGVRSATLSSVIPFSGHQRGGSFVVEGREPEEGVGKFQTGYNVVGPDYFKTLGIALLRGREFTFDDRAGSSGVVIVNESLAQKIWPGESALGQRIARGPKKPWLEVIGVAADVKEYALDAAPEPYFYQPILQRFETRAVAMVRPVNRPEPLIGPIREQVRRLNPNLPVYNVTTLDEVLGMSAAPFQVNAMLTSLFGLLALVLAAVGLYGLIAFSVTQRTREIGIRMALGAERASVVRLMIVRGVALVGLGLVLGLVLAGLATRLIQGMLFDVSPMDPASFAAAAVMLLSIAFLACYLPARRASRVDPVEVLRVE